MATGLAVRQTLGGASPLMLRDAVARFRGRALGVADSYGFSRLPLRPGLARIGP